MVVRKKSGYKPFKRIGTKQSLKGFNLIQSSFPSKKVSRQFPFLAGVHSALDGALLGILISVALMSTLALHWRHLWTVAFTQLEASQNLSHRLMDSTAMLERNLLKINAQPISMVPTKAENLLYLKNPFLQKDSRKNNRTIKDILEEISYYKVNQGY